MKLKARLILRFVVAMPVIGALFFLSAGTFSFWQAWSYLAIWMCPAFVLLFYFLKHDPKVVERRLRTKERENRQMWIMRFLTTLYLIALLLAGLDRRFGWSSIPLWLTIVAQVMVLGGYLLVVWVMKVNRYAARTIQVEKGQQLIADGPYGALRHPMYAGICVTLLFSGLALGSYIAALVFLLIVPLLVLRLLNEEKILRQELAGYTDYCERVRNRLVPRLW